MTKNNLLPKQLFLLFTLLFVGFACHDDLINEEMDLVDEDMIAATQLVDAYISKSNAREEGDPAITVLRYINGVLHYDTNTDTVSSYQPVFEETTTAFVEPGDQVFWYAGEGVSDLDGIEFDDSSQEELDDDPDEIEYDLLWIQQIPLDADSNTIFKYDILYKYDGLNGESIRLDPKIRVQ